MRSLADDLRARTDDELGALLVPPARTCSTRCPAQVTALAQRAGSPPSVAACLRGYDQLTLHVVLAAALSPDPVAPAALIAELARGASRGRQPSSGSRPIVRRLRVEALLWGTAARAAPGRARPAT